MKIREKDLMPLIGYIDDEEFKFLMDNSSNGLVELVSLLAFLHEEKHIKEYIDVYGMNLDVDIFAEDTDYYNNLTLERLKNINNYCLSNKHHAEYFFRSFFGYYGISKLDESILKYAFNTIKKQKLNLENIFEYFSFYNYMNIFPALLKSELNYKEVFELTRRDDCKLRKSDYEIFKEYINHCRDNFSLEKINNHIVDLVEDDVIDLKTYIKLFEDGILDKSVLSEKDYEGIPLLFRFEDFYFEEKSSNDYIFENIDYLINCKYKGGNFLTIDNRIINNAKMIPEKYINSKDDNGKNVFHTYLTSKYKKSDVKENISIFISKGLDLLDRSTNGKTENSNISLLTSASPSLTLQLIKSGEINVTQPIKSEIMKTINEMGDDSNLHLILLQRSLIKKEQEEILKNITLEKPLKENKSKKRI